MTRIELTLDKSVIKSSVIPSLKYSCLGSSLRFLNGKTAIELYFYGEAFIKDQAAILARLNDYIFNIAGVEKSVKINRVTLGSGKNKPWNERLMPFVIIIAIMMGGMLLPASSLVEEKHKTDTKTHSAAHGE